MLILSASMVLFILALAIAALASTLWGRGSKRTNTALRNLGMGGILFLFCVGQVMTWHPHGFAWIVLSWSADYYKIAK